MPKTSFLSIVAVSISLTFFVILYMSTSATTVPEYFMKPKGSNPPNFANHKTTVQYAPEGAENIFFMIKTGGSELWNKLPVHLYSSIPKMTNFQFYSDAPGTISGHQVIDSLENVTETTRKSDIFEMYRFQRHLYDDSGVYDYSESKLNKGWDLDKFKNIPILRHAYKKCPQCEWFFMMDADSYVMVENMAQWVKHQDPNKASLFGSVVVLPYGDHGILFAHGGSGIMISRKAAEITIGTHDEYLEEYERLASNVCCGDAVLAKMLHDKGGVKVSTGENSWSKKPFQGNSYWDVEVTEENWCVPLLTFHHATPHDIQVLWQWEKSKLGSVVTYGDVYRDFYREFITDKIDNWDNNAKDVEIKDGNDKGDAWKSFDDCRAACDKDDKCLSFRHIPGQNYCGLGHSVRLGRATHKYLDFTYDQDLSQRHNAHAQSGWMVDRIRDIRRKVACDDLDPAESGLHEGYYWKDNKIEHPEFSQ